MRDKGNCAQCCETHPGWCISRQMETEGVLIRMNFSLPRTHRLSAD